MKDFYDDERRATSDEVPFGASWRTQGEGPWQVLWLRSTGELAAFDAGRRGALPAGRLGVQALLGGGGADEVVVLGVEPDETRLRDALEGWEEHMPEGNGLSWLAERAASLGDAD
jgi:hypothetical protein